MGVPLNHPFYRWISIINQPAGVPAFMEPPIYSTLWETNITMENHHFQWVNPLFLWSFSIAMLNYQRVYLLYIQNIPLNHH